MRSRGGHVGDGTCVVGGDARSGARYTPAIVRIGLACAVVAAVCIVEVGSTSGADTRSSRAPPPRRPRRSRGAHHRRPQLRHHARHLHRRVPGRSRRSRCRRRSTSARSARRSRRRAATAPRRRAQPGRAAAGAGRVDQRQPEPRPTPSRPRPTATASASATSRRRRRSRHRGRRRRVGGHRRAGGLITSAGSPRARTPSIDSGNTRTATATADIGSISLANGAVVLGGLHWGATQTSGAATPRPRPSRIGSLTVAGATIDLSTSSDFTRRRCWPSSTRPVAGRVQHPVAGRVDAARRHLEISPLTSASTTTRSAKRSSAPT